MMDHPGLYLCKEPGKNWGLHAVECSAKVYLMLKTLPEQDTSRVLNPIIQGDCDHSTSLCGQNRMYAEGQSFDHSYLFVEFWTDNQALILEKSRAFAASVGEELILE